MHPDRIYRHFCMMARALEVIGERWSLLLVRDLLLGPRRFTDLARTLSEITPTRLTDRLRHLEAAGIVVRERPGGGREGWYQLTDAGLDFGPAIEALTLWGLEHARQPPLPGESVHGVPVMLGTKVWLNTYGARPSNRVAWVWRLGDDEHYALRLGDDGWELARGPVEVAAVTVVTTAEAWARFLTTPREHRRLPLADIQLEASRAEAKTFAKAFAAELGSI
jgi:DNA-binding HxlR family transcriptional regulator